MTDYLPLVAFAVIIIAMVAYARRAESRPENQRRRVPTPVLLLGPLLALVVVAVFIGMGESFADAIILAAPALITGGVSLVWALMRRGA